MEVTVINLILITLTAKQSTHITLVMVNVAEDLITPKSVDGMEVTVPCNRGVLLSL